MIQYNFGKTDFKYNLFIKFTLNSLLNLKKSIPDRLEKLKIVLQKLQFFIKTSYRSPRNCKKKKTFITLPTSTNRQT